MIHLKQHLPLLLRPLRHGSGGRAGVQGSLLIKRGGGHQGSMKQHLPLLRPLLHTVSFIMQAIKKPTQAIKKPTVTVMMT